MEKSFPVVLTQIKAFIARIMLDEDSFWKIYQEEDIVLTKAVEVIMPMRKPTVL